MISIRHRPSVPLSLVEGPYCNFCKLPAKYARELAGCRVPVVLQLELDNDEPVTAGPKAMLVTWNGGISEIHPDSLELSRIYVQRQASLYSVLSNPGSEVESDYDPYYIVNIPSGVLQASSLELIACTDEDWRLINIQADMVEKVLLNQTSVVCLGNKVMIVLSPKATLHCYTRSKC